MHALTVHTHTQGSHIKFSALLLAFNVYNHFHWYMKHQHATIFNLNLIYTFLIFSQHTVYKIGTNKKINEHCDFEASTTTTTMASKNKFPFFLYHVQFQRASFV